jgi:hypothetical protein
MKMKELNNLINMADGGLRCVDYDLECESSGCETCGYGGRWIKDIKIQMKNSTIIITTESMYDFDSIDEGEFMSIITRNIELIETMTEEQFSEWIKEEVKIIVDSDYTDCVSVMFCKSK